MAFDKIKTEIGLLLTEMQNEPKDVQQIALRIHEKIRELQAYGLSPPQDLVDLELALESEMERDRLGLA